MIVSPNLGLKIWNSSTDPFNSSQLADNLRKIDEHDHANGRGKQIPTGGLADGSVTNAKLDPNLTLAPADDSVSTIKVQDGAIDTAKLADNSVTSIKIVDGSIATADLATNAVTTVKITDANVTGAKLATDVFSKRLLMQYTMGATGGLAAGTYIYHADGVATDATAVSGVPAMPHFTWNPADWTIAGKSTKWYATASCVVNGTTPGVTIRPKIMAVNGGVGGSGTFGLDIGGEVAGSPIDFVSPIAGSQTYASAAAFTAPGLDGVYVPAFQQVGPGSTAGASVTIFTYSLYVVYT